MKISDYKRAIGIISKKEAKAQAPKGAEWCDIGGTIYYKIVEDKVMMHVKDDVWMESSMLACDLNETHHYRLK